MDTLQKKQIKTKFIEPLVAIIYGMLSMARGVYQYGVESVSLMDVTEEIASLLDIDADLVLNPNNEDLEYSVQKLREEIEGDAHECAVNIAKKIERRIKGIHIDSKEEIAECLHSLGEESVENLYISVCGGLELTNQKDASEFVGVAILYYIQGDVDKYDSIIDAFSEE